MHNVGRPVRFIVRKEDWNDLQRKKGSDGRSYKETISRPFRSTGTQMI
jgi:hypothetical protein